MGKQSSSRPKKQENVGKGKVTPVQIAFIVDRYLSDNRYSYTRSAFRSEASHLISKSPVQEAPKSLLSLGAILEEYITLKEQKLLMDQERCRFEQEKLRVQNLLRGMEDVMTAYNNSANAAAAALVVDASSQPLPPPHGVVSGGPDGIVMPPAAGYNHMPMCPAAMFTSRPSNVQSDPTNFSTPIANHAATKRKVSKVVSDGPMISKKSRRSTQPKDINSGTQQASAEKNGEKSVISSVSQPSGCDNPISGSPAQGSSVVKCLFNQKPPSPPTNSSVPKTPPIASSQTEKSTSPTEACRAGTSSATRTPQHMKSTNCTIISSERIRVSPNKQIAYYSIEKNHCISTWSPAKTNLKSSNVKDHVKGKLDFGASDMPITTGNQTPEGTSTSESDGDILDLDFSNLDALGLDFNLSDLLVDFDIGSDALGLSPEQEQDCSPDSHSGSPSTSQSLVMDSRQMTPQFSSTMAGILGEKDMNLIGPDSVAAVRSVTKCVILSPVKTQRQTVDQEN